MTEKNVKLNINEISTLRGILFEYYQTLRQDYMCDEEREAHVSLESKLAKIENEFFFDTIWVKLVLDFFENSCIMYA